MGDRDALIVICWLGILILIFFECFYRKLKSRLSRADVQPPSEIDVGNCVENIVDAGRFTAPISISCSKEVCISMAMGEEPPPSYEEALSYASLVTKFQFSPYPDRNIRECGIVHGVACRARATPTLTCTTATFPRVHRYQQHEDIDEEDEPQSHHHQCAHETGNDSEEDVDSNNNDNHQCNVILADDDQSAHSLLKTPPPYEKSGKL